VWRVAALSGRPILLRRSYARVWALGCTAGELGELDVLVGRRVLRDIEHLARRLAASSATLKALNILCIGSRLPLSPEVSEAFALPNGHPCAGLWSHEQLTGLVRVNQELALSRVLLHELCHGVIGVLSDGFAYPPSLAEGFAEWITTEALANRARGVPEPQSVAPARSPPRPGSPSVLDLLDSADPTREGFLLHSRRLVEFLGLYGDPTRTVRDRVLGELRTGNIRGGRAVYAWMLSACGCSASELERGYAACGLP
jgi:hypothetical protein